MKRPEYNKLIANNKKRSPFSPLFLNLIHGRAMGGGQKKMPDGGSGMRDEEEGGAV